MLYFNSLNLLLPCSSSNNGAALLQHSCRVVYVLSESFWRRVVLSSQSKLSSLENFIKILISSLLCHQYNAKPWISLSSSRSCIMGPLYFLSSLEQSSLFQPSTFLHLILFWMLSLLYGSLQLGFLLSDWKTEYRVYGIDFNAAHFDYGSICDCKYWKNDA